MLLELLANPQIAKAPGARVDTRFDEPLCREIAVRLEPVEHGFDLFGKAFLVRFAAVLRLNGACQIGARPAQQLAPQLDAALLALRQPLQRARLEGTGSGHGAARAGRLNQSLLTTFNLPGGFAASAPGSSRMPSASRTLFSISNARSGFSFRNSRELSLPWPIFSPL